MTAQRKLKLGARLVLAAGGCQRLRQQQRHLLGTEFIIAAADGLQMRHRGGGAAAGQRGLRGAVADFQIAGERALQASLVSRCGLFRVTGRQQSAGETHLVLRGGRELVGIARFAQFAAWIQRLGGDSDSLAGAVLDLRIRQVIAKKYTMLPSLGTGTESPPSTTADRYGSRGWRRKSPPAHAIQHQKSPCPASTIKMNPIVEVPASHHKTATQGWRR
jgi:hypothetical protein